MTGTLERGPLEWLVRRPTRPAGAEPVPLERSTGVGYDTAWARRYPVRLARAMLLDDVASPLIRLGARPTVYGLEYLTPLDGPIIVTANHASHLDTALMLSVLPARFRHHVAVAAAADYFFDRRWKSILFAFALGAIPVERNKVSRRSADLAAELIEDGWNLLIFPEGGRSPDGWGQEFKGGAAYLAKRCQVPVVPVHLRGTRAIWPPDGGRVTPGSTEVRLGTPLWPQDGEDARRFAARIETAVALLADEAESDWWSARRRAAAGATAPFRGPQASPWRRAWSLPASADPTAHRTDEQAVRRDTTWPPEAGSG